MSIRPRRSVLYMPGSKARALEKARTLPADGLILDLEDAVAPAEKAAARDMVADAVAARGFGQREVIVRINGLDTDWGADDLKAAVAAGPDAILVPKVESAAQVQDVVARMEAAGASETTALWAMMETPRGMLAAAEIAAASPRLTCLIMGTNDLVKDLGARHTETRLPVITALGLCMLAARAHGLAIIDGVYNAFKDQAGLHGACVQSREIGFDGRTLIHPAQIETANQVFAPSDEEISLARRYVEAFAEAEAAGQGVAVVDGRIVENLHVETARDLLALAEAIADLETAQAEQIKLAEVVA
ncbi:MAG: CoA ester lyase [Pseudomonadota bacterium]